MTKLGGISTRRIWREILGQLDDELRMRPHVAGFLAATDGGGGMTYRSLQLKVKPVTVKAGRLTVEQDIWIGL